MRSALQDALSAIKRRDGMILGAIYRSEDRSRFDVENILVYNVGARKWAAAESGIRFERAFERPPAPPGDRTGLDHYHRYEPTPTDEGWRHWDRGEVLGRFEIAGLGPRPPAGPAELWLAIRQGDAQVLVEATPFEGPFGVRLTLQTAQAPVHPVPMLKAVLDATVSAFHVHRPGPSLRDVAERIAGRLGVPAEDIIQELTNPRLALLGAVDLVRPYGSYVMWNPSDDRCVAAEFLSEGGGDLDGWLLRGELLDLHPGP